jgi:hypothetical protein
MEQPMSSYPRPREVEWKEILTKGAAAGVLAAIAGLLLSKDKNASIYVASISVPGPVALGVGASAGASIKDLAHKYLMPHIPANQKYKKAESAAICIASAGLGTYLVSNMLSGAEMGPAIALGAGSYISSDFIYHNFINKKEGGFLY